MDKMTKDDVLKIMVDYQLWRKGKIDYFPVSPSQLSKAIDICIIAVKSLTDDYIQLAMKMDSIEENLAVGDKVMYKKHDKNTYGIVKEVNGENVHVVFSCDGDWDNYQNYNAWMCFKKDLVKGWPKNI